MWLPVASAGKLFATDRFLQHLAGAQRQSAIPVGDNGNDDHRHPGILWNLFEAFEEGPAVHAGQHDIEGDEIGTLPCRQLQRGFGCGGPNDAESRIFKLQAQKLGGLVVVLDDQSQRLVIGCSRER